MSTELTNYTRFMQSKNSPRNLVDYVCMISYDTSNTPERVNTPIPVSEPVGKGKASELLLGYSSYNS